jgi:hypothetical protein
MSLLSRIRSATQDKTAPPAPRPVAVPVGRGGSPLNVRFAPATPRKPQT